MALVVPSVDVASLAGYHSEIPAKLFVSSRVIQNHAVSKRMKSRRSRVGARVCCSRIKDLEVGISDLGFGGSLGELSEPLKSSTTSPPKKSKEEEEKQNYYVNTGYAIRTLREEFPELFYRELSFDIYREDIVFRDPINTFAGIENYKSIFGALRFHGKIFFKALWLDIISVWQPSESTIMVRWTVHGIPRVPWESRGRFDGTSEYKLDKDGKIYEHRVHNIAFNGPPKFRVLAVDELIRSLGVSSTPKPTYFEISPFMTMDSISFYLKLTWVCDYLALVVDSRWKSKTET